MSDVEEAPVWQFYELDDDEITMRIEVDGIVSSVDAFEWYVQPMVRIMDDPPCLSPSARQMWNNPPTEAELDLWVHEGEDLLP